MNFPEWTEWFPTQEQALNYARDQGLMLYDLVNPSNMSTPGQVFQTIGLDDGGTVLSLTADVRLSGRPRWWWVELVECNHADHRHLPYKRPAATKVET